MKRGFFRTFLTIRAVIAAAALLLAVGCLPCFGEQGQTPTQDQGNLVWQFGNADGKRDELVSVEWRHGVFDAAILHMPEYDRKTCTFTRRIDNPLGPQATPAERVAKGPSSQPDLKFPAGLSTLTSNFIIGDHTPRNVVIEWNEAEAGPRVLEIHTTSWINVDYTLPASHYAFENYGDFLRVNGPDGSVSFFQLPITSGSASTDFGRGTGDLAWRMPFTARKGRNRLEMSTLMYPLRPVMFFDYVALRKIASPPGRKPVLVMSTGRLGNAFFDGQKVTTTCNLYNLSRGRSFKLCYQVEDFFGKLLESRRIGIESDAQGRAVISIVPNIHKRGHFQIKAWLTDDNKPIALGQCTSKPILPIAVLAPPEPPSADDINSRFGFEGGMCEHSNNLSLVEADQMMKIGYTMGARWHRFNMFGWHMIEPQKGDFYWQPVTNMIDLVRRNHLNIMAEFMGTPDWAKLNPADTGTHVNRYEVPRMDEFKSYVAETVTRFKGKIAAWEYMNEPAVHYGYYNGNAYGEMMKTITPLIHSIDPKVQVIMGCIGSDNEQAKWTRDAVKTSGTDALDVATVHYVGGWAWKFLNETLASAGISGKPVWDTEQHFNNGTSDLRDEARELVRQFPREMSYGIKKVFYFDFMGNMVWGTSNMWFSPLMVAYRGLAHQIDHTDYLCTIAPISDVEGHAFVHKNGKTVVVLYNNAGVGSQLRNAAGTTVGGKAGFPGVRREVRLRVGSSKAKMFDMMDNPVPLQVKDGVATVVLGKDPVYIQGIDRATLLNEAVVIPEPGKSVVVSGGTAVFKVDVNNVFKQRIAGKLVVTLPKGLKLVSGNSTAFDLAPGQSRTLDIEISTPASAPHKQWRVGLAAQLSAGPSGLKQPEAEALIITNPVLPGMNLLGSRQAQKRTLDVIPDELYSVLVAAGGKGQVKALASFTGKSGESLGTFTPVSFTATGDEEKNVGVVCVPPGAEKMALAVKATKGAKVSDLELSLLTSPRVNLNKLKYSANCPRIASPMSIDGDITKWERLGSPQIVIDKPNLLRRAFVSGTNWDTTPYDWRGPKDLSAKVYARWDAENLYVAARVWDDVVVSRTDPSLANMIWYNHPFGDALQIAVDPDNATADDRLFIFTLSGGHVLYTDVNNYSTQGILPTGREISSEVKYSMKTIDGGMAYEIAIPWKLTMSPPPTVGQAVGLCVGMQEFDDRYRGWMEWPARTHTTYLVDPNELGQIVMMR